MTARGASDGTAGSMTATGPLTVPPFPTATAFATGTGRPAAGTRTATRAGTGAGSRVGAGAAGRPESVDGDHDRGPAGGDPVAELLRHLREPCAQAVDPLEIAVLLEAHGLTDRTVAARYRRPDLVALAEELHTRTPRRPEPATTPPVPNVPGAPAARPALTLLPGALGLATGLASPYASAPWRPTVLAVGVLTTVLAARAAFRTGPAAFRTEPAHGPRRLPPGARAWTCWLLGYTAFGDGLLAAVVRGGPDTVPPFVTAPLVGLALALAPAAGCVRHLARRTARALVTSRGLDEFTTRARALLLWTVALFTALLAVALWAAAELLGQRAPLLGPLALGVLLLLARLLVTHGRPGAPGAALTAAGCAQAAALTTVLAARLPGWDRLAAPVDVLVALGGPGAVPALSCGAAALALLAHAGRVLPRASAHGPLGGPAP
ncbi:hypothetical protein JNUCC64_10365 [Streptomyces sp. JNUCC 64]